MRAVCCATRKGIMGAKEHEAYISTGDPHDRNLHSAGLLGHRC
jgi:hypothetical protein